MSRPLPPNWTLEFTDDGSPYYYNSVTGETSWEKPVSSAPASNPYGNKANTFSNPMPPSRPAYDSPKLPPGWEEAYTDNGDLYYYNSNTGETAWEKPVATTPTPPLKSAPVRAVPKTPNSGPPKPPGRTLPVTPAPRNDNFSPPPPKRNNTNDYPSPAPPPRRNVDAFASPPPRRPGRDDNYSSPPPRENALRRSNSFSEGTGKRSMSPPPRGFNGPATTPRAAPPTGGRRAPAPVDTPGFNSGPSSSPGDKSGWLTKQGHVMPNWKRRWFVLRGSQLSYYGTQSDPQPKGVISLDNVKYEKAPYMNKANCFAILPRNGKNYYIYSDTSNEYDDWLEVLCKASGLPPGSVSEPSINRGSAPTREPKVTSTPTTTRNDKPPEGRGNGGGGSGGPPREGGGGGGAPREGGKGGEGGGRGEAKIRGKRLQKTRKKTT